VATELKIALETAAGARGREMTDHYRPTNNDENTDKQVSSTVLPLGVSEDEK
jgi:hypothetical protein